MRRTDAFALWLWDQLAFLGRVAFSTTLSHKKEQALKRYCQRQLLRPFLSGRSLSMRRGLVQASSDLAKLLGPFLPALEEVSVHEAGMCGELVIEPQLKSMEGD
jgi:hypothetical protein